MMASLYVLPIFRYGVYKVNLLKVGKTDFTDAKVNGYETRTQRMLFAAG